MSIQTQEARIILAIEAIRASKKLGRRTVAKIYNVPYSTLTGRMNGRTNLLERRPSATNLTALEENVLSRYIIDLDSREFAPRLGGVEDMANHLLETHQAKRVGKLWAHRFVQRRPERRVLIASMTSKGPYAKILCLLESGLSLYKT